MYAIVLGLVISTISFFISFIFKHRGFIHSVSFCIVYYIIVNLLIINVFISVIGAIGCYTHLVLDNKKFKLI